MRRRRKAWPEKVEEGEVLSGSGHGLFPPVEMRAVNLVFVPEKGEEKGPTPGRSGLCPERGGGGLREE